YLLLYLSLFCFFYCSADHRDLHSFPTRRSSDLERPAQRVGVPALEPRDRAADVPDVVGIAPGGHRQHQLQVAERRPRVVRRRERSEEHTSELQSRGHLVCRLLLEKKKKSKIEPA